LLDRVSGLGLRRGLLHRVPHLGLRCGGLLHRTARWGLCRSLLHRALQRGLRHGCLLHARGGLSRRSVGVRVFLGQGAMIGLVHGFQVGAAFCIGGKAFFARIERRVGDAVTVGRRDIGTR
jgi:hypothetical protein